MKYIDIIMTGFIYGRRSWTIRQAMAMFVYINRFNALFRHRAVPVIDYAEIKCGAENVAERKKHKTASKRKYATGGQDSSSFY